jgi:hypothetical protein
MSKQKILSADECLLVTRYRRGRFRIVKDDKGWRIEMNIKPSLKERGHDV